MSWQGRDRKTSYETEIHIEMMVAQTPLVNITEILGSQILELLAQLIFTKML